MSEEPNMLMAGTASLHTLLLFGCKWRGGGRKKKAWREMKRNARILGEVDDGERRKKYMYIYF